MCILCLAALRRRKGESVGQKKSMQMDEQWECRALCTTKTKASKYRGGERKTPVTMACPECRCKGKTSYELSWKLTAMSTKHKSALCVSGFSRKGKAFAFVGRFFFF